MFLVFSSFHRPLFGNSQPLHCHPTVHCVCSSWTFRCSFRRWKLTRIRTGWNCFFCKRNVCYVRPSRSTTSIRSLLDSGGRPLILPTLFFLGVIIPLFFFIFSRCHHSSILLNFDLLFSSSLYELIKIE